MGWQAHRGEPAKTSVAKTGDAPSRLRISQLTPLNQKKSTKNSKSEIEMFACLALYTYIMCVYCRMAFFWVSRKWCSRCRSSIKICMEYLCNEFWGFWKFQVSIFKDLEMPTIPKTMFLTDRGYIWIYIYKTIFELLFTQNDMCFKLNFEKSILDTAYCDHRSWR